MGLGFDGGDGRNILRPSNSATVLTKNETDDGRSRELRQLSSFGLWFILQCSGFHHSVVPPFSGSVFCGLCFGLSIRGVRV